MQVFETIKSRRSIGRTGSGEEPSREIIELLLQAAVEAPNHHVTEPWRFFVLRGKAREAFGEVHAEALRRRELGLEAGKLEGLMNAERAKFLRSPILIVVAATQTADDDIKNSEDFQACSAAIENMLIAAHEAGLAATWRTGLGAYDPYVKSYLGLNAADKIAAILYVGYPDPEYLSQMKPRLRSFVEHTTWLDG